jgi:P4 family phage/plasmid primase-like protien
MSEGYIPTEEEFWQDVKTYLIKKEHKQAVNAAADTIILFNHFKTMFDTEQLWHYEKGVYKPVGESMLKHLLEKRTEISEHLSRNFIAEVIASVKRKTFIEREQFKAPTHLICFENGIYNLKTKKMEKHSHEYYFTNKSPIKYKPETKCLKIKKFIEETVEPKYVQTMFQITGYCFYRGYTIQKAFMLTGDGANGKSVYTGLIEKIIGEENIANEELQDLSHSTFSKAELFGKQVNICADLPSTLIEDNGTFKKITGNDTISAQKKFGNPFNFKNQAKLVFCANEVPEVKNVVDAFFRRWIIIDFPFKFRDDLQEEEYNEMVKKANKHLLEELTSPEELEGFVAESINGLHKLLDEQVFDHNPTIEEIKEKYLLKSNSARVFVEFFIEEAEDYSDDDSGEEFIVKEFIWKEYQKFCKYKKVVAKSPNSFFGLLKTRWATFTEKKTVELGVRKNCFVGVKYTDWRLKEQDFENS